MRVDKLKEAYPNLTPKQQEFWDKNVFGLATSVNASVRYGTVTKTDDKAEVDFTLLVNYRSSTGTRSYVAAQRQHATLLNGANGWQIVEIR